MPARAATTVPVAALRARRNLALERIGAGGAAGAERCDEEDSTEADPLTREASGTKGRVARSSRFLLPEESCAQVGLVSYPRSDNSLLRSLLEEATGVVTGSDTPPHSVLSQELARRGLRGEGVADRRAWLVEPHWPERRGVRPVELSAALVLVRSPSDAVDSYLNLVLSASHGASLAESE